MKNTGRRNPVGPKGHTEVTLDQAKLESSSVPYEKRFSEIPAWGPGGHPRNPRDQAWYREGLYRMYFRSGALSGGKSPLAKQ